MGTLEATDIRGEEGKLSLGGGGPEKMHSACGFVLAVAFAWCGVCVCGWGGRGGDDGVRLAV